MRIITEDTAERDAAAAVLGWLADRPGVACVVLEFRNQVVAVKPGKVACPPPSGVTVGSDLLPRGSSYVPPPDPGRSPCCPGCRCCCPGGQRRR